MPSKYKGVVTSYTSVSWQRIGNFGDNFTKSKLYKVNYKVFSALIQYSL